MPLIDVVTDGGLSDAQFIDTFLVTRNIQTMSSGGMAVDTPTTVIPVVYGVVTAVDNSVLSKFPESEQLHGAIVIYTTFRLTDGRGTSDFDVVTWGGQTYQVISVSDWSQYGRGYIQAVCKLNVVSP